MLNPADDNAADFATISERDADVLKVIEEEELAIFSFEGLKRRIGVHPETLSRTLERLQGDEILEKGVDGYRVTRKGRDLLEVHPAAGGGERLTLLNTMLPPGMDPQHAFHALRGRWFGNLRWLGCSREGGLVMKWVTEDGKVQLDARFAPSGLTIEGRLLQGRALSEAVTAAHRLFAHISRLSTGAGAGKTLLFQPFQSALLPN